MRKDFLMRFFLVTLLPGSACAQRIQNSDMFLSVGPLWNKSHTIGGTNVTVADSLGFSYQTDYGYQVARASAASLMLDVSFLFAYPRALKATEPILASPNSSWLSLTLGLRLMVPVHSRLSFYAVSGAGGGIFASPLVTGGAHPLLSTYTTTHGVFVYGGGADVRLERRLSLRAEVRDLVTGKELSGTAGRHHVLPLFGVAFHF